MYKVITGDATNPTLKHNEIAVIPHVCNNINSWGKGFVLALSAKWEKPEKEYHSYMFTNTISNLARKTKDTVLGDLACEYGGLIEVERNIFIAKMIAQRGTISQLNLKPIKYAALVKSMEKVAQIINDYNLNYPSSSDKQIAIHTPKFGCGLAGGNWDFIEELIIEIWCMKDIDVTVYEFEENK